MNRRVGIVPHAEQQYLPVKRIDATGGTLQAVRHVQRMRRRHVSGSRARRRKGMRIVAAENAGEPPEGIRHDAHSNAGRRRGIERMLVVVAHAGHDERPVGPEHGLERGDEAVWAALNRTDLRERRVDEQDAAGSDTKLPELV